MLRWPYISSTCCFDTRCDWYWWDKQQYEGSEDLVGEWHGWTRWWRSGNFSSTRTERSNSTGCQHPTSVHCSKWIVSILTIGFSQTYNIGNIGIIANVVFPYRSIYNSPLYLHHVMLATVKLVTSVYKRIIVQGCRLHWYSSFLKERPKQSWQH